MKTAIRFVILGSVLALGGWIGVGVYRAGGDVPRPLNLSEAKLTAGHAEGRRVDGKPSWSLDYDRVVASADTTLVTLENVRHGIMYRHGQPFMQMKAKHVVVNRLSNDFIVTGPLELIQNDGKHKRRLTSDAADYSGALQTLTLAHQSNIDSDGTRVRVAKASVNFHSGDLTLGPIIGLF